MRINPFARQHNDDPIVALVESNALTSEKEVERFTSALDRLPALLTDANLAGVLDAFDDDSGHPEVTFDMIHLLEKIPSPKYERAILTGLPRLRDRAPWWAEVLIIRILNSEASRTVLIDVGHGATPDQRQALRLVLDGIDVERDPVGIRARDTVGILWPS